MRTAIAIFTLGLGLLGTGGGWAAEQSVTLDVENMTCALCPFTVRKAIEAVDGVRTVSISMDDHTAVVTFDDAHTDAGAVAAASTDAGYPARPRRATP